MGKRTYAALVVALAQLAVPVGVTRADDQLHLIKSIVVPYGGEVTGPTLWGGEKYLFDATGFGTIMWPSGQVIRYDAFACFQNDGDPGRVCKPPQEGSSLTLDHEGCPDCSFARFEDPASPFAFNADHVYEGMYKPTQDGVLHASFPDSSCARSGYTCSGGVTIEILGRRPLSVSVLFKASGNTRDPTSDHIRSRTVGSGKFEFGDPVGDTLSIGDMQLVHEDDYAVGTDVSIRLKFDHERADQVIWYKRGKIRKLAVPVIVDKTSDADCRRAKGFLELTDNGPNPDDVSLRVGKTRRCRVQHSYHGRAIRVAFKEQH